MHKVDPDGVVERWRETIQHRKYTVSSPLALWHIDGNHKLIRYTKSHVQLIMHVIGTVKAVILTPLTIL